jgi:hypothetical protein
MTGIKPEAKHFAIFECNIPKHGFVQFYQTKIASVEMAVNKPELRKILLCKIAIIKDAAVIFTCGQRMLGKVFLIKNFILYISFVHKYSMRSRTSFTIKNKNITGSGFTLRFWVTKKFCALIVE